MVFCQVIHIFCAPRVWPLLGWLLAQFLPIYFSLFPYKYIWIKRRSPELHAWAPDNVSKFDFDFLVLCVLGFLIDCGYEKESSGFFVLGPGPGPSHVWKFWGTTRFWIMIFEKLNSDIFQKPLGKVVTCFQSENDKKAGRSKFMIAICTMPSIPLIPM